MFRGGYLFLRAPVEDFFEGGQESHKRSCEQTDFAHGGSGSDTDLILHHNITAVLNHTGQGKWLNQVRWFEVSGSMFPDSASTSEIMDLCCACRSDWQKNPWTSIIHLKAFPLYNLVFSIWMWLMNNGTVRARKITIIVVSVREAESPSESGRWEIYINSAFSETCGQINNFFKF